MRKETAMNKGLTLAGSLGIGAGLMYLLDPDRGRRRRALLRDQAVHAWHKTGDALSVTAEDLTNRARGLAAETGARLRREDVTDDVLAERVRSKIGRVVSHPRAMEVAVDQGRVTLTGLILADEVDDLLASVASVRGVTDVENRLEAHPTADGIPALQGGRDRPGEAAANWPPATRLLVSSAGCALASYGAKRRDAIGAALGTVGVGMLARGLSNIEMKRLVGANGGRRGIDFQKTININVPAEQVFALWSSYENFPRFMSWVQEVKDLGGGRSHWVVKGPAGVPVEWDAELTEYAPHRLLAWKSVPGAAIANAGVIHFDPNGDGTTRVDIKMTYNPPAGTIGHAVADLLGGDPKRIMDEDLARMKTFLETGQPPHDAAQRSSPTSGASVR
jgi:uncharacterized membrane protein